MAKRSSSVPLLLLGTLVASALVGCDNKQEVQQQQYKSLEDCQRDWGRDGRDCKQGAPVTAHSSPVYVGPRYYFDRDAGQPMIVDPSGTTRPATSSFMSRPGGVSTSIGRSTLTSVSVSRGGFGSSHGGGSEGG